MLQECLTEYHRKDPNTDIQYIDKRSEYAQIVHFWVPTPKCRCCIYDLFGHLSDALLVHS